MTLIPQRDMQNTTTKNLNCATHTTKSISEFQIPKHQLSNDKETISIKGHVHFKVYKMVSKRTKHETLAMVIAAPLICILMFPNMGKHMLC